MAPSVRSLLPQSTFPELAQFVEPPWDAPIHVDEVLSRIPADATISGMFPLAIVHEAQRQGRVLPSARARYVPFSFYPMHEHVRLLLEICPLMFPRKSLRQALRSVGRAAPHALLSSTLGKVTLGAVDTPAAAAQAMAKTYALNQRPGRAEVLVATSKYAVVSLHDVYFFADSHHVGVFEGTLRYAGATGTVHVHVASPEQTLLLLSWS